VELGWGGYWAWDPVENASFMPWLTATAFLHSVMIQERKNMLKVWNISLIILSYALTLFGTFLVRSGVLTSVHAFADSNLGSTS
jgi:cytochrome c-type biogenesis protein CcmF